MIFHDHNYIFNNDGYQVCTLCGVCTSLQDMRSVDIITDYFEDILQKREDAAERRHKETMNSLVEVMKQVANKK